MILNAQIQGPSVYCALYHGVEDRTFSTTHTACAVFLQLVIFNGQFENLHPLAVDIKNVHPPHHQYGFKMSNTTDTGKVIIFVTFTAIIGVDDGVGARSQRYRFQKF